MSCFVQKERVTGVLMYSLVLVADVSYHYGALAGYDFVYLG